MHASPGEDRSATAEPDPGALFRMRIAMADAAFVAEGVTLGLLRWCPGRHGRPSTAAATRKVRSEQGSGGRVAALAAATWQALGCPR